MPDRQRIDMLMGVVEMLHEDHARRIEALETEVDRLRQQQTGDVRRHDAWLVTVEGAARELERLVARVEAGV